MDAGAIICWKVLKYFEGIKVDGRGGRLGGG